ncbi:MAG: protein kinase [Pyrinomonadaceae bacterium]|nr:protein kinase [Pyrinomonadaceae bacterium]
MQAEWWQQIEVIFESALAMKGAERAAYLDRACAGDEALRQEVESLLAAYEKTGSFMNVPAHEVAAQLIAADYSGLRERGDESLSSSPTLLLNRDVARGDDEDYATKSGSTGRLRILLVGLFFTLMFVGVGVNSYHSILYFNTAGDAGWLLGLDGRVRIYSGASAADVSTLRDGDEVVSLDGRELKKIRQYFETFRRLTPGTSYTMVIRRDGRTEQFSLRTASYHPSIRLIVILQLVLPVTFMITGLAIFLFKQDDRRALLLALMLGMLFLAGWPPFALLAADLPWWLAGVMTIAILVGIGMAPVILHFFLIFPERSPLLIRFPRIELFLYLPYLLTAYPIVGVAILRLVTAPERVFSALLEFQWVLSIPLAVGIIYLLGAVLSLVVTYRRVSQVSRRKLRLILVGTLAAFLPGGLVRVLIFIFKPSLSALSPFWLAAMSAGSLALLLFPFSFAYSIVRHQVIPVSLIIRRSLQYLFATNGLRIIFTLPIIGLLVTLIANPNRTLPEILFQNSIYFYLLLIAAFSLMFRRPLSEWVDRKFFREAYNQEKILRELIDELKHLDSLPEMSKHVSDQVERALHPERIYLFHREEEKRDLLLGHSSGQTAQGLRIPAEFQLLRFMEREGRAVEFPPKNNLPFVEKAWLAGLGTNLIVPITSTSGRLSGLFLLGEKKSEVPYTATDRQLLEAVASQIAVVYENVQLKECVVREQKIKREVLARIEKQDISLLRECPTCGACYDNSVQFCAKDQSELTLTLPVERTIDERYRLDQLIGSGGMGAVYEATDVRLHRKVAVKILGGGLFGNSEALRRFEREAQAAARLTHPHIITVYDYGVLKTEGAYLVMELVRGETLGSLLKREQRLAPAVAAEWLDQTLAAVGAAHQAGIIHRDLKPDNIFVADGEKGKRVVKVLDFGLAKITHQDAAESKGLTSPMTTPGTVMGTFGYMSPEQLTGAAVDERSDIFSIGVIAVEALTGKRPFRGRTYHELLTSILSELFHLERSAPEMGALDEVLQRCLAKDPQDRFTSAAETQRALIPAIRRCPTLTLDSHVSPMRVTPS